MTAIARTRRADDASRTALRTPALAIAHFGELLADRVFENVAVALLGPRQRLLSTRIVGVGTEAAATIPINAILRAALLARASGLLLAHNHPSGDPRPSARDFVATRRLTLAATALSIDVVDHIVIASGGAFSFRVEGYL